MNYHMSFPIPSLTSNLCEVRAPHKGLPLGCEAIDVSASSHVRDLSHFALRALLPRPPTPTSLTGAYLLSLDPPEPLNVDKTS